MSQNLSQMDDETIIIYSAKTRKIIWICVSLVVLVHLFAALVLSIGNTGVRFRFSDHIAIFGVGIILALLLLIGLRPKIILSPECLIIRNLMQDITVPWDDIVRFDFDKYWAYTVLDLEERIILLSVPIIDGQVAVTHMNMLRQYLEKYHRESRADICKSSG